MKWLLIIFGLLLSSCATVPYEETADGILDGYVGEHYHEVILNNGPPNDIYRDGNGGYILEWSTTQEYTRPGLSYSTGNSSTSISVDVWDNYLYGESDTEINGYTITAPPSRTTSKSFFQVYIDTDGTVYHHRHNVTSEAEDEAARKNEIYKTLGYTAGVTGVLMLLMIAAE